MKGWNDCTVCQGTGIIEDDQTGIILGKCEVSPPIGRDAYLREIGEAVARLRAAMEALRIAQLGLDLSQSCGLPLDDASGREMWGDAEVIRIKKLLGEIGEEK